MMEVTKNGVLINAAQRPKQKEKETNFQKLLREERKHKARRRQELIDFLSDPEVQAYYNDPENIV